MFQVAHITYAHVVYAPMCTPIHIYILIQASDSEIKQLSKQLPHPATSYASKFSFENWPHIGRGVGVRPDGHGRFLWCPSDNYEGAVEITNNSGPVCRVAGGFWVLTRRSRSQHSSSHLFTAPAIRARESVTLMFPRRISTVGASL